MIEITESTMSLLKLTVGSRVYGWSVLVERLFKFPCHSLTHQNSTAYIYYICLRQVVEILKYQLIKLIMINLEGKFYNDKNKDLINIPWFQFHGTRSRATGTSYFDQNQGEQLGFNFMGHAKLCRNTEMPTYQTYNNKPGGKVL